MTITFQNINDEEVKAEHLCDLNEYYKVFSENQIILKKEFYINNILKHISHYKNNIESEDDIIELYSSSDTFYSIIEKLDFSNYSIEVYKEYSGIKLKSHSRDLYNNSNNLICQENIDLLTGLPKFEETEKYFYDFEKDDYFPIITASFNEDGSLNTIRYDSYRFDGQDEIIFSEDDDMTTLQNLLGLSSNEIQYYLNAILEPQK
ncbi:hypothetical protein EYY60_00335 [Flavobacterium zhairuonense]|uniref:hypothetical protein n=1 Tax=Flavobacterium zhairuonense TaxID=2493631 RepID=UPI001048D7A4|nr:hypothetical protein [Flavobacterium zhairuonense]KAF2517611.1 hypothetical protein EYY60_00335 [Flavobacterium zhairuonense]